MRILVSHLTIFENIAGYDSRVQNSAGSASLAGFSSPDAHDTRIVRTTGNELGEFDRMQDTRENFKTVHNPGTRAREVSAGIYEVNFAAARSGH